MVPHRAFLRSLSLAALSVPGGRGLVEVWATDAKAAFPLPFAQFLVEDVYAALPSHIVAYLMTSDPAVAPLDPTLLAAAKAALGLTEPLPDELMEWRKTPSLRIFIETCGLAGVAPQVIAEDLRRYWGLGCSDDEVAIFLRLFADRTQLLGMGWLLYETAVGTEEAQFKRKLLGESPEFIRWSLGVPVQLDNERVLDRMISDAYFTERLLKREAGSNGLMLSKDTLARVKLERETIFKSIDRKMKLKESSAGGTGFEQAHAMLKKITMEYGSSADHPTLEELNSANDAG